MRITRPVDVRVLGPLEVYVDGYPVGIPGAKPRVLLTMLGLYAGRVVPAELLQAVLWGSATPPTARKALQTHVSTLRRVLGQDTVATRGSGWQLAVELTDATEFDAAVRARREAARSGSPALAVEHFDRALATWRGLPQLPQTLPAQAELTRWNEVHDSVVDDRADALLACGHAAELVSDLEAAVAHGPLRERRWAQLSLALYRAGRQGDALSAYQRARSVLADELGVEPGPELRRLEAAILSHDETLLAQPAGLQPGTRRSAAALPVPPSTLVGRQEELAGLRRSLDLHRLVTVVGPGGVGKTRLAIAAAQDVAATDPTDPSTVWFVDLAAADPQHLIETVAATLGTVEHPDRPLERAIFQQLGARRSLLLLDNCEHLAPEVGSLVERLLVACPDATVLATSRERLAVAGEQVIAVPPMSVAGQSAAPGGRSDAEQLFFERVHAVEPEFDADPGLVREVCTRCDGLPLAIELAAARCPSLGIDGLLAGLDDRLRVLTGARRANDRHRSMRAVLDWSYDLLDQDERLLFRRLGAFVGAFDLTSATMLAGDDSVRGSDVIDRLGRLTDKNLLVHQHGRSTSRWRMLGLVRSYAREQLAASGDDADVAARYLRWASRNAHALQQRLEAGERWREEFELVAGDLRAALAAPPGDGSRSGRGGERLALALALASLDARSGAFTLAQVAYEEAMAVARTTGEPDQVARAALGASVPGMLFGVTQAHRVTLLEEALAAQHAEPTAVRVRLLARLSTELYWSHDRVRSRALAAESGDLADKLGDPGARAHALYAQHYVSRGPNNWQERLRLAEEITAFARQAGETQLELAGLAAHAVGLMEAGDLDGMALDAATLGDAADQLEHPEFRWYAAVYRLVQALVGGRFDDADQLAAAATESARYAPEFAVGLYFAEIVTDLRKPDGAELRRRAHRLAEMVERFPRVHVWRCLSVLGAVSMAGSDTVRGDARDDARALADELLTQQVRDGHWLVGCCLLAEAAAELPDPGLAERLAAALRPYAGSLAVAGRVAAFRGSVSHALGLLALTRGQVDRAVAYLEEAAAQHDRMGAEPFTARSLAALERARGAAS